MCVGLPLPPPPPWSAPTSVTIHSEKPQRKNKFAIEHRFNVSSSQITWFFWNFSWLQHNFSYKNYSIKLLIHNRKQILAEKLNVCAKTLPIESTRVGKLFGTFIPFSTGNTSLLFTNEKNRAKNLRKKQYFQTKYNNTINLLPIHKHWNLTNYNPYLYTFQAVNTTFNLCERPGVIFSIFHNVKVSVFHNVKVSTGGPVYCVCLRFCTSIMLILEGLNSLRVLSPHWLSISISKKALQ